jgi:hypothetical protein
MNGTQLVTGTVAIGVVLVTIIWKHRESREAQVARIAAASSIELTHKEWHEHSKQHYERALRWQEEREQWEQALDKHLAECEKRWLADGWLPRGTLHSALLHFATPHGA